MKKQPKQLVNSSYERRENDAYYTEAWLTNILLRRVRVSGKTVCDPAAGRGDILKALDDWVFNGTAPKLYGFDIDPPRKLVTDVKIFQQDYLEPSFKLPSNISMVITNPPFGDLAQKFVEKTITNPHLKLAAFLLRCNWNTSPGRGNKRVGLFDPRYRRTCGPTLPFAYEIIITERPRWDWWYKTEKQAADDNKPFHSYSWFVWDREWKGRPSTQFWEGR